MKTWLWSGTWFCFFEAHDGMFHMFVSLFTFFVSAPSGFGALYWVADSNPSSSWLFRVLKQKRFDNFFCHPPIEIKGRSSEPHDVPCKKWPGGSTLRVASFESEATTGIQRFFSWCWNLWTKYPSKIDSMGSEHLRRQAFLLQMLQHVNTIWTDFQVFLRLAW